MLKKLYLKELEKKEAMNDVAKEEAYRDEQSIEYLIENPLVVNEDTKILTLEYFNDIYDDLKNEAAVKKVRVTFKDNNFKYKNNDRNSDPNPYVIDILTSLSLDELEDKIANCETEEDVMLLSE